MSSRSQFFSGRTNCLCLPFSLSVTVCEFQILTDWQDKKGDRRFLKLGRDHELGAPPKHGKPKKQKLEGKAGHGPGPGPGRPKSKNLQPKIQEYEFTDDPIDVPRIPKNDAPNRFWAREHRWASGFGHWRLWWGPGLRLVGEGPSLRLCFALQILGFSGALLR